MFNCLSKLHCKVWLSIQALHIRSWITGLFRVLSVDSIMVVMHSVVKGRNFWSLVEMVYIYADSSPVEKLCMIWSMREGFSWKSLFMLAYDFEVQVKYFRQCNNCSCISRNTCNNTWQDKRQVVDITCQSDQSNPNQFIICWVAVAKLALYAMFLFVYLLLDIFYCMTSLRNVLLPGNCL